MVFCIRYSVVSRHTGVAQQPIHQAAGGSRLIDLSFSIRGPGYFNIVRVDAGSYYLCHSFRLFIGRSCLAQDIASNRGLCVSVYSK